jgi:hypothetical protein
MKTWLRRLAIMAAPFIWRKIQERRRGDGTVRLLYYSQASPSKPPSSFLRIRTRKSPGS